MDTKGKDSWRHARAGAVITTTVAANEIATIQKGDTSNYQIDDIIKPFKNKVDIVIFEGFRKLVREEKIPKIVAAKNKKEVFEALEQFKPIIAYVGPYSTQELGLKAPYVDVIKNPDELANIIIERIE
jgi:molybdopterin-guanine dinucleotide biosynthesis protein MobB